MPSARFRHITVAIDGSPIAREALLEAIDLAKQFSSTLEIITVAPLQPVYADSAEPYVSLNVAQSDVPQYRAMIDNAVKQAKAAGVAVITGVTEEGVVVDELLGYLEKHPPDLLVMGSRGLSSAKRLLLGSVSEAILHHATCPVLIVRAAAKPPPARAG